MKSYRGWTIADVVVVALGFAGALLIDWRASLSYVEGHVVLLPASLLVAYLLRQGRRAEGRMLTRSEPPPVVPPQRSGAEEWASSALTTGPAFVAGWITKSLPVYASIAFGMMMLLAVGHQIAAFRRQRNGLTV